PTDVHGRADIVAAMTSDPLAPAASPLDEWPPRWAPDAVIFDCDGLLVDTEGQWVALQDEYLARHGTALDPATRRRTPARAAALRVLTLAGAVAKGPPQGGAERLAEPRAHCGERLTPLPGALETLRAIAAVRPVAIASNAPRDMLDTKLDALGLAELVDTSIAIEDVGAPKPAPDMYLTAARALGADPVDCLGFDDSE